MSKGKNSRNVDSSTIWTEFAKAETQPKKQPQKETQKTKSENLADLCAEKTKLDLLLESLYTDEYNMSLSLNYGMSAGHANMIKTSLRDTKVHIADTKKQRRCIKNELLRLDPTYHKAQMEKVASSN